MRTLYGKLLNLYPAGFREKLGESMQQTFNDLWLEKQRSPKSLFGFMLQTLGGTAAGILYEHFMVIKEMDLMKNLLASLKSPALVSFLLVLPFMLLEWVNRRNLNEGFPFPLFGILWLLPLGFLLILTPIVRKVRAGKNLMAKPISLLFGLAALIFIALIWGSLVMDQLPCFLGAANCD